MVDMILVIMIVIIFIIAIIRTIIEKKSKKLFNKGIVENKIRFPHDRFPFKTVRKALKSSTNPEDIKELQQTMNLMYLMIGLWLLLFTLTLFLPKWYK